MKTLTVTELKSILQDVDEFDESGKPVEVWVSTEQYVSFPAGEPKIITSLNPESQKKKSLFVIERYLKRA